MINRRDFTIRLSAIAAVFGASLLNAKELAAGEPDDPEREQIWTTATGEQIMIKDMTDDHLRNCIFYQNKSYGYCRPHRIMGGNPGEYFPLYNAMRREANRRNLSWI